MTPDDPTPLLALLLDAAMREASDDLRVRDVARQAGPRALAALGAGRIDEALKLTDRAEAAGGAWGRFADGMRLVCGVALATEAARKGDAARASRIVDRLLARLRARR